MGFCGLPPFPQRIKKQVPLRFAQKDGAPEFLLMLESKML